MCVYLRYVLNARGAFIEDAKHSGDELARLDAVADALAVLRLEVGHKERGEVRELYGAAEWGRYHLGARYDLDLIGGGEGVRRRERKGEEGRGWVSVV